MRGLLCLFAVTVAIFVAQDRDRSKRTTEAEAIAALDREIEAGLAADTASGTIVIAKHGKPIFTKTFNRADRTRGVPNTLETSFNVGSINKFLTAVTTLRLVQDKRLALTDTVGKFIPDYPNREIADNVTIHHLLTHTGGTGNIFDENYDDYRLKLRSHDDYVKYFGERPPVHAPGARFEYSNYGFVLLGAIIERVTGHTYYDVVAESVYAPAGMTGTKHPIHDEPFGAIGYTKWRTPEWTTNADVLPYRGTSAGGGFSTSVDLLRFANALQRNVLLDEAHTKLLTTGKLRVRGGGFKQAYGCAEMVIDGVRCFGHNGGFPGVNGELLICDNGYTIATLANFDPPAAGKLAHFIVRRLPK
jgi:CubicO group peptidase (beta-lactamase class C family)